VALVTGAASGIGAASARALAARGARVAVVDLDEERGRAVARGIGGLVVRADVSAAGDWAHTVERVEAELGPIELAHLNAGVMTLPPSADIAAAGDLANLSDAAYRRIVGVNVDGVFFGLRALARVMAKRGRGRIVATASIAGLIPVPFDPLYAMTKHAIVGLVRSSASALAARGIALAAICPGGVDTPIVPDYVRSFAPPLLSADEVARAVVTILESGSEGGTFIVQPGRPEPEPVAAPSIDLV
jgi:NAD(P)-dependent dehydrogenase (short-subunit alcohol dehydrogenase family)